MKSASTKVASLALLIAACGGAEYSKDPLADEQWYIRGDSHGAVNINLVESKFKGDGILVAVVDNGIDRAHEDLRANIAGGNVSYLPPDVDFDDADHGTAVAGIIAAVEGNGVGVRGIAPRASLVAFNAARTPATSNLADALGRDIDRVDISNNSWGDFNGWGEPFPLRSAIAASLERGTSQGRSGKGIVYVFAAGNGAELTDGSSIHVDNVNYSGLVNNRWTLPICAVDERGRRSYYSERGATLLVCAPSGAGQGSRAIVTTDATGTRGFNPRVYRNDVSDENYTLKFSGTSAAAPIVSAVVALILEANPELSWRDVRSILASTAQRIDPSHPDWSRNGAGLWVNHDYGFGLVDADKAVSLAQSWVSLGPPLSTEAAASLNQAIPDDGRSGIAIHVDVVDALLVEFIDLYLDAADHPRVGELEIDLISPAGTVSRLAERHKQLFGFFRYRNWRFGTVRHLGEMSTGRWTIRVKDLVPGNAGTLSAVRLVVHGSQAQAANSESSNAPRFQQKRSRRSGTHEQAGELLYMQ